LQIDEAFIAGFDDGSAPNLSCPTHPAVVETFEVVLN
jgi:hypothetical protein